MKRDLRGRVVGGPDRRHGSVIREETSNYWVGIYNSWQANADTIALALHQALSRFSAPRYLKIDNGRDFLSERVRSICYANNIEIIQAEGYHGQSKPCERGIRQILHDFCKSQEGYCGNNTQSKPDTIRATQTAEEFEAKLNEWLKEYHTEASTALGGRSPNQVLNSFYEAGFKETPLEAGALRILLMHSKSRTVRQYGIQLWRINGESIIFQHPELYKNFIGKKVEAFWDPRCIGEAHIYARDGERLKFICSAQHAPLMQMGATSEDLHRTVYEPRKVAKAFHRGVKAEAESTYKSLLERIGDAVRERLDLPELEALPLAVNQGIPRINQWSYMACEIEEAKRHKPAPVDVDPVRALDDMAQQRRSEELEQINRSYEKSMRLLELFDDQS